MKRKWSKLTYWLKYDAKFWLKHTNLWPWNAVKTVLYWRKCARRGYSDWFIDECDSTMNSLMITSLKFHMHMLDDKPVTYPFEGELGDKALSIIDRLDERRPQMPDELSEYYLKVVHTERVEGKNFTRMIFPEKSDRLNELTRQHDIKVEEYYDRQREARHDFIDILPNLWS